ncbi:MAG: pyridoxamine 5'-phosphate oxidase family protein [Candidatus Eisenbacteria bacterium]|nr:pyridoxamine 5'-phosphate oxidase family protein [Candidatus Eisenbacteria bacterium]
MDPKVLTALSSLVRQQRTLALGSIRDGGPQVTLAAYAVRTDFQAFYLFLSRLARHTRAIEEDNQVGFMIAEPDSGVGDPQTLQRLSLQGTVVRVDPRDDDAEIARSLYLERFPDAVRLLQLGDFSFFRITPTKGRFVAGFAQAYNVGALDLSQAAESS